MKEIKYRIKDKLGIHARPAGNLAKIAKKYSSTISLEHNGTKKDCKNVMNILSLGAKTDDIIEIFIDGSDELLAYEEIETFLNNTL